MCYLLRKFIFAKMTTCLKSSIVIFDALRGMIRFLRPKFGLSSSAKIARTTCSVKIVSWASAFVSNASSISLKKRRVRSGESVKWRKWLHSYLYLGGHQWNVPVLSYFISLDSALCSTEDDEAWISSSFSGNGLAVTEFLQKLLIEF